MKLHRRKHIIWQRDDALSEAGTSGAFLERSWSFLVPREATKPIFFELIANFINTISCTQSTSLCVAMYQRVL